MNEIEQDEWTVKLRDGTAYCIEPDYEDYHCPFCAVLLEEDIGCLGDNDDPIPSHCPQCSRRYELEIPYEKMIVYSDATLRLIEREDEDDE